MSADDGSASMPDPIGFLLTWTTYGSWLQGDARGWMSKPGQLHSHNPHRLEVSRQRMKESELTLDPADRQLVEQVIAEHCRIRGWVLHAVRCRTQHVHVVLTAIDRAPDEVRDQLKAWCTRRLKDRRRTIASGTVRRRWWTQSGSKRRLYEADHLLAAIRYVQEGQ
jgi:REP element-mobilizing transposase RayT